MDAAQRIGPVARLGLNERYIALAARAICLRHPQGRKLATTRPEDLSDGQLAETVRRLEAWVAEQPPIIPHPDSHRAKQKNGV